MEKDKQAEASAEKPFDFSQVTPCGENCAGCQHKISGACSGCLETEGRNVTFFNAVKDTACPSAAYAASSPANGF